MVLDGIDLFLSTDPTKIPMFFGVSFSTMLHNPNAADLFAFSLVCYFFQPEALLETEREARRLR